MHKTRFIMAVIRWATGAVILSLASTFVQPARVAEASELSSACRHTNRVNASFRLGSQVDGSLVTICLTKSQLQWLKAKPSLRPKVPVPSTKPSIVARPKSAPRVPQKPVKSRYVQPTRPKIKVKPRRSSADNSGVFRPRVDSLIVNPATVDLGQRVAFTTNQRTRFGRAKLLGNPVIVKFVPIGLEIDFGDSTHFSTSRAYCRSEHLYLQRGSYQTSLKVTYSVFYRIEGGRWFKDPESIALPANPVNVLVGTGDQPRNKLKVVLVSPIG